MDKLDLHPHYLTQLRNSGIFTEGDLLELEDHFFTIYEAELDSGQPAHLALQRAEQTLGKREAVIAAFAQKRKGAWAKDLGSFFVFGLVVNLLGLWCLGIGVGNLFSILIHYTTLAPAAPWLSPVLMGSFVLLLTILQWKIALRFPVWHKKLPTLISSIKLKHILLPILGAFALASISDPFVRFSILLPEGQPAIWDTNWFDINWTIWATYFPLNGAIMTAYFGWKAHQNFQKQQSIASMWSLRMVVFFLTAWLSPMVNFILLQILRSDFVAHHYQLASWIGNLNTGLVGAEFLLMLLFPFAYKYIWQRKQYLA